MNEIWWIRHAESLGNAGEPTVSSARTPLSARGAQHAQSFAEACPLEPTLIVSSTYDRARQTAQPLVRRFPNVRFEEWDAVREFTYLNEEKYRGTTHEDRKEHVAAFWEKNDPLYKDGGRAESFCAFMERTIETLNRFITEADGLTIVFSHEFVIRAVAWLLLTGSRQFDSRAMLAFAAFRHALLIPNMAILRTCLDTHQRTFLVGTMTNALAGVI
jgi:2,3-bisphosphoglycerate-dependent phosphoglycerate mutase